LQKFLLEKFEALWFKKYAVVRQNTLAFLKMHMYK